MAVALERDLPHPDTLNEERPCELCEEHASQGYKTGHMRYVLGLGLGLAALAMVVMVAAFSMA